MAGAPESKGSPRRLDAGASGPSGLLRTAARVVVRLRWVVTAFWVAAAAAAVVFLPTIEESQRSGLGDLVPTESVVVY